MGNLNVQEALLRIRDLPTLPTVMGRILSTTSDPEASALDLGKLIAADQSLSATVLKLVNSAYYGFYRQIKSVTQAIVMLGFLEVRNLALTATAFRALHQESSSYDRIQLWRHALATAMAAERSARVLNVPVSGCFESGLLHDIGKVAFDLLYPLEFRDAARQAHAQSCIIAQVESEVFGLNHAEVGGALGEHWNLPTSFVEAITRHHAPGTAADDPRLTAIIAISDAITYTVDLGESSNGCAPPFPDGAAALLGLQPAQRDEIGQALRENQQKIDEFVGGLKETAKPRR
jgi:putative nucleotidyltransferase with HDIG domain